MKSIVIKNLLVLMFIAAFGSVSFAQSANVSMEVGRDSLTVTGRVNSKSSVILKFYMPESGNYCFKVGADNSVVMVYLDSTQLKADERICLELAQDQTYTLKVQNNGSSAAGFDVAMISPR